MRRRQKFEKCNKKRKAGQVKLEQVKSGQLKSGPVNSGLDRSSPSSRTKRKTLNWDSSVALLSPTCFVSNSAKLNIYMYIFAGLSIIFN